MDAYTRQTLQSLLAGVKAHMSQMLVGNPGYGKSALVNDLAHNYLHCEVLTVIGSQKEPTDVTGFPALVEKPLIDGNLKTVTDYAIPSWQFEIMQKKKIVLFLDEFSNSTPAVQAAMLQILNEREFPDGSKVPDETVIIGAMNPVETAADGYELTPPVANRLKFIPWEPSLESWSDGLVTNWGHSWGKEGDAVTAQEMHWRKQVVKFLKRNRNMFYVLPDKTAVANAGAIYKFGDSPAQTDIFKSAYPSPRSWTNLARVLPYCSLKNQQEQKDLMVMTANGIVGYKASRDFIDFVYESSSLPPTKDILADPEIVEWPSLNMNQILSILSDAMNLAKNKSYTKKTANLFIYLNSIGLSNYTATYFNELQKLVFTLHDNNLTRELMASQAQGQRM